MQLIEMDGPDWANLARELVACIMKRIQMGHSEKGEGRRIVALAGVCRSWRKIVLEEWKARFTFLYFPCSLRTPGPTVTPLQCMLRKTRKSITMFQGGIGDEYFVLAARRQYRPLRSCYVISSDPRDFSTNGPCCKALLLSDFWRNHFAFRDLGASANKKKKSTPTLLVDFQEKSSFGMRFRRLSCRMLISSGRSKLEKATHTHIGSQTLPRAKESIMKWGCLPIPSNQVRHVCDEEHVDGEGNPGEDKPLSQVARDEYLTLESKEPQWDIREQKWALDFKGRCTVSSIHNFQLLSSNETVVLQLGKVGHVMGKSRKELFTLDYASPLSALEAFSICITSFATRSGLEP